MFTFYSRKGLIMDLKINNIKFNNTQFSRQKSTVNSLPIKPQYLENSTVLPDYHPYIALSLDSHKQDFDKDAFLLPRGTKPDKYQIDAAISLHKGNNTIVTAPTGTGKTAIAHFIIKKNFEEGKKTFYTTPLKALSNQKYLDLQKLFGKENVGILTGDRKENAKAPIVLMTTEIYRNMVASHCFNTKNDMLDNLATVIFDEFHYMGDADRGSVWEESIMFTPPETQILALSATVGNNQKITNWINSIKNKQADLIEVPPTNRHVPLKFIFHNPELNSASNTNHQVDFNVKALTKKFFDGKFSDSNYSVLNQLASKMELKNSTKGRRRVIEILHKTFKNKTIPVSEIQEFLTAKYGISPEYSLPLLLKLMDKKDISLTSEQDQFWYPQKGAKQNPLNVIKIINKLQSEKMLPAIAFVFSKKYSEKLLDAAMLEGKDLTTNEEKEEIVKYLDKYKNEYNFYSTNLNIAALLRGYAIHSAAILPLQKQLIEELFNKKLIKVTFATETLAAGINMPARTVIMTDYQKPNGKILKPGIDTNFLRPLSSNEFHQMSGRAGRRGIDKIGYVILLNDSAQKQVQFEKLIHSEPESISSTLKIDASTVTGFFEHLDDPQDMERILRTSFSIHNASSEAKDLKLNKHMIAFYDYIQILEKYGFLQKIKTGFRTTDKGDLINEIKGRPQIPIVKAILDKRFANLSAQDFVAIISAIASNQDPNSGLYNIVEQSDATVAQKLEEINDAISRTLEEDFGFSPQILSSANTNDEIIIVLKTQYADILKKDLNKLTEERNKLLKIIYREEKEVKKNHLNNKNYSESALIKLKKHAKRLKVEQSTIKRIAYIKGLLDARLGAKLQNQYSNQSATKYNVYNALVKDFTQYNAYVSTLTEVPKITMNPTSLFLVGKWAEANAESDDYKANWQYICSMLNETGSIKYEGDLFNSIAQTIDFIHQIEKMLAVALKADNISAEDKAYYNELLVKCKDAICLIKRPPLYNIEDVK